MKIVRWAGLLARMIAILIIQLARAKIFWFGNFKDRDVLGDLGIDRLGWEDNIRMDFTDWSGFITFS